MTMTFGFGDGAHVALTEKDGTVAVEATGVVHLGCEDAARLGAALTRFAVASACPEGFAADRFRGAHRGFEVWIDLHRRGRWGWAAMSARFSFAGVAPDPHTAAKDARQAIDAHLDRGAAR